MPYADPIKKKAYYQRHKKKYDAEWKKKNRDRWNKYQREAKDYQSEYLKLKNDPHKYEKQRQSSFNYQTKNKEALYKKDANRRLRLSDTYILKLIFETDRISRRTAREFPELIEAKRVLLKIKRNIYGKEN